MRVGKIAWIVLGGAMGIALVGALQAQRPFREFPGNEYNDFPLPPDYQQKGEWAFARLMYPPMMGVHGRGFRGYGRFGFDWR
ncbi:MAG TPA: DUF4159 domain-containing protein, partial [Bryobacteraceae bacterium]